jgi:hypothetical protein
MSRFALIRSSSGGVGKGGCGSENERFGFGKVARFVQHRLQGI